LWKNEVFKLNLLREKTLMWTYLSVWWTTQKGLVY